MSDRFSGPGVWSKSARNVIYGVVGLKTHSEGAVYRATGMQTTSGATELGTGKSRARARIYRLYVLTSQPKLTRKWQSSSITLTWYWPLSRTKKLMSPRLGYAQAVSSTNERERDHAGTGKAGSLVRN